jgi:HD-GYP domain-containing protein (c-di-GMP phosphodiesterase class II)
VKPVREDPTWFVQRFYQAVAVARLHDLSNAALEEPVRDFALSLERMVGAHGFVTLKPEYDSEMLFLNERAVRMRKTSVATVEALMKLLGQLGVGEIRFHRTLDPAKVRGFLALVKEHGVGPTPEDACKRMVSFLPAFGLVGLVDILTIEQATSKAVEKKVVVEPDEAVRLAYARTMTLTREFMKNLRDEELRRYFWRKLLRAVQSLQTFSAREPKLLLALTLVKSIDERHFNHAVNTCILSLLLGQKVGLSKTQLVQVGLAGLLHGLGKFRTDAAIVAKEAAARTPEEAKEYARHPYRSIAVFLESKRLDDAVVSCALASFQFEATDGLPAVRAPLETLHPLARIVSVCEAYDALTSPRGDSPGTLPDVALGALLGGRPRSFDFTLLGLLSSLLGMFPPGSAVLLDDGSFAVVMHPNPERPRRPVVVVVRDTSGADVDGDVIDLAAPAGSARSIKGTVDSAAKGLRIPEYLRA